MNISSSDSIKNFGWYWGWIMLLWLPCESVLANYSYLVPTNGNKVVIEGTSTSLNDVKIPSLTTQVRCESGSGVWTGNLMYQFRTAVPVTSSGGVHTIQITPTYMLRVTPASTNAGSWNSWRRNNYYSIDCSALAGATTWASDIQNAFETVYGVYTGPAGTQITIPRTLIGYYGYIVTDSTSEPTPSSFDITKAVYEVYISGSFTVAASCQFQDVQVEMQLGEMHLREIKSINVPVKFKCRIPTQYRISLQGADLICPSQTQEQQSCVSLSTSLQDTSVKLLSSSSQETDSNGNGEVLLVAEVSAGSTAGSVRASSVLSLLFD
ncbi:hypothetical protein GKU49_20760 [Salmonella enterica]|nr:hypothetical protein [Salmonella enterica]EHL4602860.1 hypothetical protein [Salmonella enterica subsp. enterica serovar Glostrup]EDF8679034.1 hypothetical protein [Salmonella enterica]EEF5928636.1 hypothetical protein [Salmonella enterica]EEH3405636.1 hypothetical protein [Salmonella enterica]